MKPNRKFLCLSALVVLVLALLSFSTGSANADEPNSVIVTSAYDDQSEDNLSIRLLADPSVCDKDTKSGEGTGWSSQLVVTNLSDSTLVDVSFVPNTGGTLAPGEGATYIVTSDGPDPVSASVEFQFQVADSTIETAGIDIPAPEQGCETVPNLECTLLNFTDPSVVNEDGTYKVGTVVKLETLVSGDDSSKVANIVFSGNFDNGQYSQLQKSSSNKYDLLLDKPGHWTVSVTLEDADGNGLHISKDNCTVYLDSAAASTTPPSTTVPENNPPVLAPPHNDPVLPTSTTVGNTAGEASADTLPDTGARATFLVTTSLGLLVAGVGFVLLGKRRKPLVDPDMEQFLTM